MFPYTFYRKFDGAISNALGLTTLLWYSPVTRQQDFLDYDHTLRRNCIVGGVLTEIYQVIRPTPTCEDYIPPVRSEFIQNLFVLQPVRVVVIIIKL